MSVSKSPPKLHKVPKESPADPTNAGAQQGLNTTNYKVKLAFLAQKTVGEMMQEMAQESQKPEELIYIPSDSTVEGAVDILGKNKILSAPVQDVKTSKILGMIDMFDILSYVIHLMATTTGTTGGYSSDEYFVFLTLWETTFPSVTSSTIPDTSTIDSKREKYFSDSIMKVLSYSPFNFTAGRKMEDCLVNEDAVLAQVISLFSSGLRRILVYVGEEGSKETKEGEETEGGGGQKVIGILTQYDFISYLYKYIQNAQFANVMITELGLGVERPIQWITNRAQALQGFYLMNYFKLSALAVVDENNKLVANLGISDLRGLKSENFAALTLPVLDYLQIYSPGSKFPPISVRPEATSLKSLLELLLNNKIHRVWSVKESGEPSGLVSVSDIMKVFDKSW